MKNLTVARNNIIGQIPMKISSKWTGVGPIINFIFLVAFAYLVFGDLYDSIGKMKSVFIIFVVLIFGFNLFSLIKLSHATLTGELLTLKSIFGKKVECRVDQVIKVKVFRLKNTTYSWLTIEDFEGKLHKRLVMNANSLFSRQIPASEIIELAKQILSSSSDSETEE